MIAELVEDVSHQKVCGEREGMEWCVRKNTLSRPRCRTEPLLENAKMQREGNTHVYRESKATSPSSVSIQRTCFPGQTIPRFPHGGPFVRHYGSSTDQGETTIVGRFLVTGHLQHSLSSRR
jgi:hypothetical protein